jgi:hypothetical protein
MESNYIELLPDELLKKQLFELNIDDVVSFCKINDKAYSLSQQSTFWKDYLIHNYESHFKKVMNVEIKYKSPELYAKFTYGRPISIGLHIEKGDLEWQGLYQSIINNTNFYFYHLGESAMCIENGFFEFQDDYLTFRVPIDRVKDSFQKVNDAYLKL